LIKARIEINTFKLRKLVNINILLLSIMQATKIAFDLGGVILHR